ncbi:MAG TPA: hypothetical protein VIK28_00135, partial [Sedimentisphaerales bacterium]
MRPNEDIKKLITGLKINPSPDLDTRVHNAIDDALAERKRIESAYRPFDDTPPTTTFEGRQGKPNIWRIIMRSPITKLAMAAVIIIAVLVGIYVITGKTPVVTCCAWAQIADKVAQIKTCIYNMHLRQSGGPLGQKVQEVESKIYISSDYGQRIETSLDGNVFQQVYVMADSNAEVLVMPSEKKYMRLVLTGDTQSKLKAQMQDPRDTITKFMTGPFKDLGKDTINGVEVKGIEVNNPPAVRGVYNNFIGRT